MKIYKIVLALTVLIIMAGLVSCTDENLAPTKTQNGANSPISATKDDGNNISNTTAENNNTSKKKVSNPKDPSIATFPGAGMGASAAYSCQRDPLAPECYKDPTTGQPVNGYVSAVQLDGSGILWGDPMPGYAISDHIFINENSQNPVVTGWGITNGGVKYPTSGEGPVYIWLTSDCTQFTSYSSWLNATQNP